jgi:hypothetical protein
MFRYLDAGLVRGEVKESRTCESAVREMMNYVI